MEIKKGDRFLCIKNIVMPGIGKTAGKVAYTKGCVYKSDIDGNITDNMGCEDHGWGDVVKFREHFQVLLEETIDNLFRAVSSQTADLMGYFNERIQSEAALLFIEQTGLGYHLGNAVDLIALSVKKDPKNGLKGLKDARWYLDRKISELEKQQQS